MTARRLALATPLLVFLTLTSSLYLNLKPVSAIPGVPPQDPTNIWAPYGPQVKFLQLQYYSDPLAEFNDFIAGRLDVTDWPQVAAGFAAYDTNPDFTLSPLQGEYGLFGIYFNGASSAFTHLAGAVGSPFWGCDWSNTTGTEYTSQCGIEMRQAFSHLINRGDFANNNVARPAVGLADPSPTAKDPAGTSIATQCAWDQSVMVKFNTGCYNHWGGIQPGAYTITGSGSCTPTTPTGTGPSQLYQSCSPGNGRPAVGSPDFCAAALHMINAGVATGMTSACVLTGVNPNVYNHKLRFIVRITNPRRALAQIFEDEVNALFSGQVMSLCLGLGCSGAIVFNNEPGHTDDWDAYTYGYTEAGPFVDQLYGLYHSRFASPNGGVCNGAAGQDINTPNPTYMCNPKLDALLVKQNTSLDIASYKTNTLATLNYYGAIAGDIPSYSPGLRLAALRSADGLVNMVGFSYNNPWTMLNAHKGGYAPNNPIYAFGGGDPTTLRYGQGSGTNHLNIFTAATVWEFQAIGQIYDLLFNSSPVEPAKVFCWMCDTFTQSIDSNGNEHFLIQLRQNLRWHDGTIVDAKDIAFSLLSLRDLSITAGNVLVGTLRSIKVLSNTTLDIVFNGQNISYPLYLASFIIPRHLWQCDLVPESDCAAGASAVTAAGGKVSDYTNAGINVPSAVRASPSFDPLIFGALVGSGPFMCKSTFPEDLGRIGAGCAKSNDGSRNGEALGIGATLILQAYDRTSEPGNSDPFLQYMRSYNPNWSTGTGTAVESGQFQEFKWADKDGDAHVSLSELGSVAACFDASGPTIACPSSAYNYWLKPAFHPNNPNTISAEVAIVASHLDDTYVDPYAWSSLQNIVPYP